MKHACLSLGCHSLGVSAADAVAVGYRQGVLFTVDGMIKLKKKRYPNEMMLRSLMDTGVYVNGKRVTI